MSIKISELPQATSVGSSDIVPIVQGGTTKQATAGMIAPTIATSITSSSTNNEVAGAKAVYDFAQEKYSTTEQRIGTWHDGKPLYQKTIISTTALHSGSNVIPLNISNPDWVFYKVGYAPYTDGTIKSTYTMPSYESSTKYLTVLVCSSSDNEITVSVGSNWGNSFRGGIVLTVNYTKTTDSATTNSLNTASLMNTGSLVGMGDRAELTSLASELTDNNIGEQEVEEVTPLETTKDKTEGSGDIL